MITKDKNKSRIATRSKILVLGLIVFSLFALFLPFVPSTFAVAVIEPGCEDGNLFNTQTGLTCDIRSEGCENGSTNYPACNNNATTGTWVKCADENQTCTVSGTRQVRYGANVTFFYRSATNSIACNNTTWGDPIVGVIKACYYSTTSTTAPTSARSNLTVTTLSAINITQNTAVLRGTGGDAIANPTLPVTAYFRYSTRPISPVFCNDIYSANMIATKDIKLNLISASVPSQSFSEAITGLSPNTIYYYCAIVSNSENIAYGGATAVKEFRTNCNVTTVETNPATNIRSTSAILKGSYCSASNVTTSFKYREVLTSQVGSTWTKVGVVNRVKDPKKNNIYGNITFSLTGLTADKEYEFKTVAENGTVATEDTDPETFETSPSSISTTPTCMPPRVLDEETNTCVIPPPPVCVSPQVLNVPTNTCITPTPPVCVSPQVLDTATNTCVNNNNIFPTVTVTATPSSIASGGSTVISWTSTNVTSCNAGAGNGTGVVDSFNTGALTSDKSYSVTCTGIHGSVSDSAYVLINGSTNTSPTINLIATPASIAVGGTSTISWTSTNATSCTESAGRGTGVAGSFNTGVLISGKSYTVTCSGIGGTTSETAYVYINGGNNLFPTVNVQATPPSVASGGATTVSWTSTNTVVCNAGAGRGTGTTGSFGTGILTIGKSFSVTCSGAGGANSDNVYVYIDNGGDGTNNIFPTVSITANPLSIASGGSSTISWTSTNAAGSNPCNAGAGNGTGVAGSFNTGPLTSGRSYTVTCNGTLGTGSDNVYVFINSENSCANGASNPPLCSNNGNSCPNGATNPPICNSNLGNSCTNGAENYPTCSIIEDSCINGMTNPPLCTVDPIGACANGATNPTLCTVNPNGSCINGATNPTLCTVNPNGSCVNGGTNPPACTTNSGGFCINGGTNPPLCTINSGGSCVNGANNPVLCTINSAGTCLNNAKNPPACTTNTAGACLNNAKNPPACTTNTAGACLNNATNPPLCNVTNLVLGQKATPPWDAIVRLHEGIETVFTRQIIANPVFAKTYGYKQGSDLQTFAWDLSDKFARTFGYVDGSGREIRVSFPDIAAYQLVVVGNKLTVYEYYDGKIVDIRNVTTVFKNASGYEYYFKK